MAAAATKWSQSESSSFINANIFCVALDQLVARVGIVGLLQPSVLAEVVQTNYFVPVYPAAPGSDIHR